MNKASRYHHFINILRREVFFYQTVLSFTRWWHCYCLITCRCREVNNSQWTWVRLARVRGKDKKHKSRTRRTNEGQCLDKKAPCINIRCYLCLVSCTNWQVSWLHEHGWPESEVRTRNTSHVRGEPTKVNAKTKVPCIKIRRYLCLVSCIQWQGPRLIFHSNLICVALCLHKGSMYDWFPVPSDKQGTWLALHGVEIEDIQDSWSLHGV